MGVGIAVAATSDDENYDDISTEISIRNPELLVHSNCTGLVVTEGGASDMCQVSVRLKDTTDTCDEDRLLKFQCTASAPALVEVEKTEDCGNFSLTMSAPDNDVAAGSVPVSVACKFTSKVSSDFAFPINLPGTVLDNDVAQINVDPVTFRVVEGNDPRKNCSEVKVTLTSRPAQRTELRLLVEADSDNEDLEKVLDVLPSSLWIDPTEWPRTDTFVVCAAPDNFVRPGEVAVSVKASGYPSAKLRVMHVEDDTAFLSTRLIDAAVTSEAGGMFRYALRLGARPIPPHAVSVSVDSELAQKGQIRILTGGNVGGEGIDGVRPILFDHTDWDIEKVVQVSGVHDAFVEGDSAFTLTHSTSSGDKAFHGVTASLEGRHLDDDVAGITLEIAPESAVSTTEDGGVVQLEARLTSRPRHPVKVKVILNNTEEVTSAQSELEFGVGENDWRNPLVVVLLGQPDFVVDGDQLVGVHLVAIASPKGNVSDSDYHAVRSPSVTFLNLDADTAGLRVDPSSGSEIANVEEIGGPATFTLSLQSRPLYPVTVSLASNDTQQGTVSPSSITFTPTAWNTPSTVTVTGVNDFTVDGTTSFRIDIGPSESSDLLFQNLQTSKIFQSTDENVATVVVDLPAGTLKTSEDKSIEGAQFQISITSRPTAPVFVVMSSSNQREGVVQNESPLGSGVMFDGDNWAEKQTVTVHGLDDNWDDGDIEYTISFTVDSQDSVYNAFNIPPVAVVNVDDDVSGIDVDVRGDKTNEQQTLSVPLRVRLKTIPYGNIPVLASVSDLTEAKCMRSGVDASETPTAENVTLWFNESTYATWQVLTVV